MEYLKLREKKNRWKFSLQFNRNFTATNTNDHNIDLFKKSKCLILHSDAHLFPIVIISGHTQGEVKR